jgi:hypothetical protein
MELTQGLLALRRNGSNYEDVLYNETSPKKGDFFRLEDMAKEISRIRKNPIFVYKKYEGTDLHTIEGQEYADF